MPNERDQVRREKPSDGKDFVPMHPSKQSQGSELGGSTDLINQAKSTASEAYDAVAEKATSTIDQQKAGLSGGLTSVADSIRQAGDSLQRTENQNYLTEHSATYARTAAEKLEQTARYFESHDLKTMTRDIENYARRNPAIFLGGAFVLGILAARFLKSSPQATESGWGAGSFEHESEQAKSQHTQSSQARPAVG